MNNKTQKVKIVNAGPDDTPQAAGKNPKVAYNVGAGLMVKKDNIAFGVAYNFNITNTKLRTNTGSLKLKLDF